MAHALARMKGVGATLLSHPASAPPPRSARSSRKEGVHFALSVDCRISPHRFLEATAQREDALRPRKLQTTQARRSLGSLQLTRSQSACTDKVSMALNHL